MPSPFPTIAPQNGRNHPNPVLEAEFQEMLRVNPANRAAHNYLRQRFLELQVSDQESPLAGRVLRRGVTGQLVDPSAGSGGIEDGLAGGLTGSPRRSLSPMDISGIASAETPERFSFVDEGVSGDTTATEGRFVPDGRLGDGDFSMAGVHSVQAPTPGPSHGYQNPIQMYSAEAPPNIHPASLPSILLRSSRFRNVNMQRRGSNAEYDLSATTISSSEATTASADTPVAGSAPTLDQARSALQSQISLLRLAVSMSPVVPIDRRGGVEVGWRQALNGIGGREEVEVESRRAEGTVEARLDRLQARLNGIHTRLSGFQARTEEARNQEEQDRLVIERTNDEVAQILESRAAALRLLYENFQIMTRADNDATGDEEGRQLQRLEEAPPNPEVARTNAAPVQGSWARYHNPARDSDAIAKFYGFE